MNGGPNCPMIVRCLLVGALAEAGAQAPPAGRGFLIFPENLANRHRDVTWITSKQRGLIAM